VKGSGVKQDSVEGEQGKTDNRNNSGFQRQQKAEGGEEVRV
jgi:hypothetical protein